MWRQHAQRWRLVAAVRRAARLACDAAVADRACGDERGADELWRRVLDLVPVVPRFRSGAALPAASWFGDRPGHDNFLRRGRLAPRWRDRNTLS